jgi:hypothetical protein
VVGEGYFFMLEGFDLGDESCIVEDIADDVAEDVFNHIFFVIDCSFYYFSSLKITLNISIVTFKSVYFLILRNSVYF